MGSSNRQANPYQPQKKRSKAPIVIGAILVLLVAVGLLGFSALTSVKSLKGKAESLMTNVNGMVESVKSQDFADASWSAQQIATTSHEMNDELSSPLWTAATFIPVYGEDVSSIRTLVGAVDDVSKDALVPLTQTLESNPPDGLIGSDKTINGQAVSTLLGAVEDAAPAVQSCADTVSSLPAMHISKLEEIMQPVREKLGSMNDLFQKAAAFSPLAESVLGVNGNRTYLIVAQNAAEMRAAGGFPGSIGTLQIQDGKIGLGDFSTPYDVLADTTPDSIGVTPEEVSLTEGYINTPRDAGMDPDFPRVAQIWSAAYEAKMGVHVDGVVSIAPSVVQDILSFAGSISLSDGTTLDGSNATKVLQHDLYWKYLSADSLSGRNADLTDSLFAQAAGAAFDKLFENLNSGTMMKFASTMIGGMKNRTVMFWLVDGAEQAQLNELDCSGGLNVDPTKPVVGTFFSLWLPSKMGWYIDINNEILSSTKNADGSTTYQVKSSFANTATPDVLTDGGKYIAGGDFGNFERDNLYPFIMIYAPAGGKITSFQATNGAQFTETQHNGSQLFKSARPNLKYGETIECTYEVTTSASAEKELTFASTPTLTNYR